MTFMPIRKLSYLLLGALVLSVNVAAQPASQPPKPTTPTSPSAADPASTAPATTSSHTTTAVTVSRGDRALLEKLTRGNIAEIEAGKLAQSKATDSKVKAFGQHMADDHGKALAELSGVAMRKGLTLPTEPDARHKKALEKLKALPADKFDAEYMKKAGLEDHKATLKLLKNIQEDAKDPEIRALAEKMQPTVEHHYKMAQEITPS